MNWIFPALAIVLLIHKKAATTPAPRPTTEPPAGFLWQQGINGGWFLVRADDPFRFVID